VRFYELKQRAVYQAVSDADEVEELTPYVDQYINEGYERLLTMAGLTENPLLLDEDEPVLPEWMHPAIADYATFLLLRNGNPQRQSRGIQFRAAYEETVARFFRDGGLVGKKSYFRGVYQ
jgi:hypothetical protein